MALWSGRFQEGTDAFALRFGASIEQDKALYEHDIAGSLAHARMLAACEVISQEDLAAIEGGLARIKERMDAGSFPFDAADEDIHMAVERALTEDVGDAGARLHTGRSRNDQVATDTRLHAKRLSHDLMEGNLALREAVLDCANEHFGVVMPGYTHLQRAQPVLFSHHLLAYFWMLSRDFARLAHAHASADANPLGAAALAGTTYPLDRRMTTELLGFAETMPNSIDAVSDRDYLLDLEYACSVSCMHLSRLCEELVLWSSAEFGFVSMPDAFSTGSSIMPQKRNPDFAELVRGKCGRVVGDLVALLVTCKSLPLAYDKDLQECKEGAMDAAATLADCMACTAGMVKAMRVNAEAMGKAAGEGFAAATDLADYLAKRGLPFRQAHEAVGRLVSACERAGRRLEDLSLEELQEACPLFDADVLGTLDPEALVAARTTYGGTGHAAVRAQLAEAAARQREDAEAWGARQGQTCSTPL